MIPTPLKFSDNPCMWPICWRRYEENDGQIASVIMELIMIHTMIIYHDVNETSCYHDNNNLIYLNITTYLPS